MVSLNLHSTSGSQVSLMLELEWLGSYTYHWMNKTTSFHGIPSLTQCAYVYNVIDFQIEYIPWFVFSHMKIDF
jgi:hypothetical protein